MHPHVPVTRRKKLGQVYTALRKIDEIATAPSERSEKHLQSSYKYSKNVLISLLAEISGLEYVWKLTWPTPKIAAATCAMLFLRFPHGITGTFQGTQVHA